MPDKDFLIVDGPIEPPSKNDQMRDTIKQVVEQMATDVRKNLDGLRKEIDDIDKLVIINAQRVAETLTEHAELCGSVQQEIKRLGGVIAEIRNSQEQTAKLNGHAP